MKMTSEEFLMILEEVELKNIWFKSLASILSFVLLSSFTIFLPESTAIFCNEDSKESETAYPYNVNKIVLNDLQKRIVDGAKKNLSESAEYDLTMGYYVLTYKEGVNTGKSVFPGGDLDPEIGVCTDVVVRSLRHAGIVDLQEAINSDIKKSIKDYPMSRWGKKKADPNIDHRRVMNLEVWFSKYWQTLDGVGFEPGDIVVWDMNQDGASDHIGIVSDNMKDGRYTVIHNHPDPGHIADEDKLFKWKIAGHYRIKNN